MNTDLLTRNVVVAVALCVMMATTAGCGKNAVEENLRLAGEAVTAHDRASAAKYVSQVIASDPTNPEVHLQVLMVYTRPGFHKEQVQAARNLVGVLDAGDSNSKKTMQMKAAMYSATGMLMEKGSEEALAEHCYEEAVRSDPNDPMLSNNLAYYYADRQKNLIHAEKLARYAVSIRPGEPSIEDTMGWVLYRLDKNAEAAEHLRKGIKGMPDNPDLRYHLGAAYAAQGKNKQAEIELRKALMLAPGHSDSQLLLNKLLLTHTNTTR